MLFNLVDKTMCVCVCVRKLAHGIYAISSFDSWMSKGS